MGSIELILVFYILPMVMTGVGLYLDQATRTMGDWLDECGLVFIPVLNIIACLTMFHIILKEKLRAGERWKKFRDIKIKKDKNEII